MKPVQVRKSIHIPAPGPVSVYAGAFYSRAAGEEMIEDIRNEALRLKPDGSRQYYSRELMHRRSRDNGKTWSDPQILVTEHPDHLERSHTFPFSITLDPNRDVLIYLSGRHEMNPEEGQFAMGNRIARTYRSYYQLSRDGGATWDEPRQIIDSRPGFDTNHWGPAFYYGQIGGVADGATTFLVDGTLVLGFGAYFPKAPDNDPSERGHECYSTTCYGQARWSADGKSLVWRFGEEITVGYPLAAGGCCESAVVLLDDGRVFNTMRCQGDEATDVFATRFTTTSSDGGMTWGKPTPLAYEDGSTVHLPASMQRFMRSSRTGKTYLVANILPKPVYAQTPRYPLCIAEFDTRNGFVLRGTVQPLIDRPPGAPVDRRYTNFGSYEDRRTGEFVLLMPEMPRTKNYDEMRPEDFGSDCIELRFMPPG
ncbi:MAG: glycoside hydrolase [Planctomycetes bacterium]|nr:glycoside hydrolase [Planctomycetota bacterium]